MSNMIMLIVLVAIMMVFMVASMRKQKKAQEAQNDWRENLKPGDQVATVSGLLGTVVSVDIPHDQIVINSEGSLSRWRIQAITRPPIVPAYVSDDEVDEQGNPLPKQDSSDSAAPVEAEAETKAEATAAPVESADAPLNATPAADSSANAADWSDSPVSDSNAASK